MSSVALKVIALSWFSATFTLFAETKIGALSSTSVIFIVTLCVAVFVPSLAFAINV